MTRGAVANTQINELGRMAEDQAALMKVCILGNEGVAVLLGKIPDESIVGVSESVRLHMNRVGIEIENLRDDFIRQILIEQ